jgi:8-oxo-dGTP pyrophosphatase MutT (NUDIX family)
MPSLQTAPWYQDHLLRADVPPATPREPWRMGSRIAGSIEPSLAQAIVAAGLPLRRDEQGWQLDGPADASLAHIARWLHRQGHGGKWRNELVAVTDESGAVLAAIERAAVRVLGIATQAVHLVAYDDAGRVWVQRRALDKAVDPGMLDTLVGGLAAHGESVETTLERETWEEAGLRIRELHDVRPLGRLVVKRPVSDGYMVERIVMFAARMPSQLVPSNQDGEVMGFECLDADDLVERMERGEFTFEAVLIHATWLDARSPS